MGIPSYFSQVIKKYATIIRSMGFFNDVNIDHLFMDCNSIIYDSVHEIEYNHDDSIFENKVIEKVIEKIENYVELISPKKTLYIAFDGVAPFAKMEQQRTRRHKTHFISQVNFDELNANQKWSTSAITPGTHFMNKLSEKIEFAFSFLEQKYNLQSIVVTTSKEPGEGEHKLFEYLRKNNYLNDVVSLYGLDSDLIMLSIYHLQFCKNIYIFREAPEFLKSQLPIEMKNEKDVYFLDILHLTDSIINEMSCVDNTMNRAFDYIFLCFFLGNDFLPHFPAMNIRTHGIDTLLSIYNSTVGKTPNNYIIKKNGAISWKNLRTIISIVAKNEKQHLVNEYEYRKRFDNFKFPETTSKEKDTLLQNTPIIYRTQEHYIEPNNPGWNTRYYKTLFKNESDKEFIKKVSMNYLEGLEWVFKYYTKGCIDWKWKYNYHYPPLFSDLLNYIPHFDTQFLIEKEKQPFNPYVQLSYVLPFYSQSLLPENIKHFLFKNYRQLFPDKFTFEWAFCRYFWEAHPILPAIPIELLNQWDIQFNLNSSS